MYDKRPSARELIKRLNEAKEFLKKQNGFFAKRRIVNEVLKL